MTISDLIDYLNQFDPETLVVLSVEDAPKDTSSFIALDCIDVAYTAEDGS